MSVKLISSVVSLVAGPLSYLFNMCIDLGVFPDLMKISTLFKSRDKSNLGNYRLVSILPVFSKIFEKLMLNQMLSYFNMHKLFHLSNTVLPRDEIRLMPALILFTTFLVPGQITKMLLAYFVTYQRRLIVLSMRPC